MQKPVRVLLMTAGVFVLALFCALAVFLNGAVKGDMYYDIQQELDVECGVDDETMRGLDMLLARRLAGDKTALDETELFNADEKTHMADVAAIFSGMRLIKNAAMGLAVLLLVYVYYNRQKYARGELRLAIVLGVALFFLPFMAAGIWALIDFDSAFTAMHKILFSNELWLMDPRTDLMIRMLPERFFMEIGARLAIRSALAALGVPALIFIGTIEWKNPAKARKNDE